MGQYRTFWRRFFAGFVDALVFIPLGFVQAAFDPPSHGPFAVLAWTAVFAVVTVSYTVLMHARFGQTVGKMALSVLVLDVTESRIPTLKEAVLRDIGNIVPAVLMIGFLAAAILNGDYDSDPAKFESFTDLVSVPGGLWFLTEVLTMLTNKKRRALHDFIAGTVVMRKDSVPVGVLDKIG
jgi:uncharacterized RDD family membrane protein YckC